VGRRELIALIGGTAVVWPFAALGQSTSRVRKIGVLWGYSRNDPQWQIRFGSLVRGLQQLGWVEGRSIAFELRHAVGNPDQFPALAADLVRANAEIIIASTAGLAAVAHEATSTIPIVASGGDLEGTGLISSLRRPGGNVTGIQILSPELMSKRLDLLKHLVPNLTSIAAVKPITPAGIITTRYLDVLAETAHALGVQVHQVSIHGPDDIASAFAAMVQNKDQAAIVIANPLSFAYRKEISDSAIKSGLPTAYEYREFATAGGLLSYGVNINDVVYRLASYVDKILRGATPGELPVEQPTKFELVLNLKAAKALGLTIPSTLLAQADEMIE
jgi:putative ABC transport system substrate-binding protein